MTHHDVLPTEVLDLPDPETLILHDDKILEAYQKFCLTLQYSSGQDFVLANPEYARFHTLKDGDIDGIARLRLFSALIHPDKDYLKFLFDRTFDVNHIDMQQGKFTGHKYQFGIGQAFHEFVTFSETDDCKQLSSGTEPFHLIETLSGEIASAPGFTWLSAVHFTNWTKDWGLALHYMDSEDEQTHAFPTILGFFKMDTYPYSAARLLTEIPQWYYHFEDAYVYGSDLLAFCWVRLGEEGKFNLGRHLLELDELSINALQKHYGGFGTSNFIDDMWDLWLIYGDSRDRRYTDNLLKEVVDKSGVTGLLKLLSSFKVEEKKTISQSHLSVLRFVEKG